jgi:hypothetical protein
MSDRRATLFASGSGDIFVRQAQRLSSPRNMTDAISLRDI